MLKTDLYSAIKSEDSEALVMRIKLYQYNTIQYCIVLYCIDIILNTI